MYLKEHRFEAQCVCVFVFAFSTFASKFKMCASLLLSPTLPERHVTIFSDGIQIKALTALVGRLSLSLYWKTDPKRGIKTVSVNL